MLKTNFLINPKRLNDSLMTNRKGRIVFSLRRLLSFTGVYLGFTNIDYTYVHGDKKRVRLGENCSTMNAIFNVISGEIHVGDDTILGHNCMLLTGTHNFNNGKRVSLDLDAREDETPRSGRDIIIGKGCFIGSGVTIIGPVEIGDNVVIGAGAVVTKSLLGGYFCAGTPAKAIKRL